MVVRTTEKIEAGKRNRSTQGWTGVVLNRVIRLTVKFNQSPEEVRQQALGQGHIQLKGTAAGSVRRAMPVAFSTGKEAVVPSILRRRSQAGAPVPEGLLRASVKVGGYDHRRGRIRLKGITVTAMIHCGESWVEARSREAS